MNEFAQSLVDVAQHRLGDRAEAIRVARAVCRHFGGQLVYWPRTDTEHRSGQAIKQLRGVILDEVGDAQGEPLLEDLARIFGGYQFYVPLEHRAFRDQVADEVYQAYDSSNKTMGDLCRAYRMSYRNIYALWYRGRDNRLKE